MPRVRKNQGMEFDAVDFVDSMLDGYGEGVDQEEFVEGAVKMGETRFKSKNLEAERRRRNKLNSKLFTLRSLVPNITKMSKESTITDAMDYIGKLEKRIRDLQLELAKIPDLVGENQRSSSTIESMTPSEIVHCPGKVEMNPVGKNKFHVNITCMKQRGGLTKLLEAIAMQGMEVTEFSSFAFSGFSQIVMCVETRDGFNAETDEFRKLLSVMVGASKEK